MGSPLTIRGDDSRSKSFFLYWLGATAAYQVLLGAYGLTHKYTMLPFAPVCAVFIAAGGVWAWDHARSTGARAFLVLLMAGMPVHAALRIKHWYRIERTYIFDARQDLDRLARPDDLVVTLTREHPVLLYHLHRYGWPLDPEGHTVERLDAYRQKGARYFFAPRQGAWETDPRWKDALETRGTLLKETPDYLLFRLDPKTP